MQLLPPARTWAVACLLGVFVLSAPTRVSAGTAFTYQGQLTLHGSPVNATCSMQFRLFNQSSGGSLLDTIGPTEVPVSNGVFTTLLDFGAEQLGSGDRWLEISVDCGTGLIQLAPRQALTSTPYAIHSQTAATPRIRSFTFTILKHQWDQGAHYGGGNIYRRFDVPAELTGGKTISRWLRDGGIVAAYARPGPPGATNNSYYMKPMPLIYSRGPQADPVGVRVELIPETPQYNDQFNTGYIVISRTFNGWDARPIDDVDVPEQLEVRIVVTDPN